MYDDRSACVFYEDVEGNYLVHPREIRTSDFDKCMYTLIDEKFEEIASPIEFGLTDNKWLSGIVISFCLNGTCVFKVGIKRKNNRKTNASEMLIDLKFKICISINIFKGNGNNDKKGPPNGNNARIISFEEFDTKNKKVV